MLRFAMAKIFKLWNSVKHEAVEAQATLAL